MREEKASKMPWIVRPLLFVLSAGPSMHWGDVEAGILAPLLWSAGIGIFVALAGWRARNRGFFTSVLYATFVAGIINVPAYLVGWWLATLPHECSWLDTLSGPATKQLVCGE